jgi:bacteriocin-like protein
MKRDAKKQKLLKLNMQTIRKLDENDLKNVVGGGSCLPQLPPPLPPLES